MTEIVVEGKILEWGNSYGIRIRKADLERSDLQPGDTVSVRIEGGDRPVDLSDLPTLAGGRSDVSRRHDEVLAEGLLGEDAAESGRGGEDDGSHRGSDG